MLGVAFCTGCRKKPAPEPETTPATGKTQKSSPPKKDVPITQLPPLTKKEKDASIAAGGNSAAMAVRRGIDRVKAQNYLGNIKTWYHTYNAENGRSPAKLEDFLAYIRRDGQAEAKALQDGLLTLKMNSPLSSDVVLGYETEPYTDGSRLVMMGDGSIKMMGAAEFQSVAGNR
jgi:hypothetical protein